MALSTIRNPQTWTRLRRLELRRLANEIGNEALNLSVRWPRTGEGRQVKEATEQVARLMDGEQPSASLSRTFNEIRIATTTLNGLLGNPFFIQFIEHKPSLEIENQRQDFGYLIRKLSTEIEDYITDYEGRHKRAPASASQALREATPPQKIGPITFIFEDGVLKIDSKPAVPPDGDKRNVDRAREALLNTSRAILENMSLSNCDRRLTATFKDLQARLETQQDIIALGLASISNQMIFSQYDNELPPIIIGQVQAFVIGLSMYVGQFPEWIRFTENAAMAEYSADDVKMIQKTGNELVEKLRASGSSVDSEIPRTLRWMVDSISYPRYSARKAIFAAIRTIENFVSVVFTTCGKMFNAAVDGAGKGVKIALAGTVAVSLLTLAANVAKDVSPAAERVIQATWLSRAAEIALKALSEE